MPDLVPLALRYVIWFVGLRIVYALVARFTGLPDFDGTTAILAALPATDIGLQAARRAERPLILADWAKIFGTIFAVFAALFLVVPALLVAPFRAALADPAALMPLLGLMFATLVLMGMFLLIGSRMATAR